MKKSTCVVIAAVLAVPLTAGASGPKPELFAPGVISGPANDGSPAFMPDGNTLYFTRSSAAWTEILESRRVNGQWTEPEVASFSGEWPDSSPGVAPDGSYLIFTSTRPTDPANPKSPRESQLYRVDRTATGWSEPQRLPPTANIGPSIWKPSIAADGTLYFVSIDKLGHKRLYSAQRKDAGYLPAKPLAFSTGTTGDVDPEIAPDGSFLVFCASGRAKGDEKERLFIVHKTPTGWGAIQQIHYDGEELVMSFDDEPHLSVDHHSVYFASDRRGPVHFPRTHAQAIADLKQLESWDNGQGNVWVLTLDS